MKRWIRPMLCMLALTGALAGAAMAAEDTALSRNGETYTVTYSGDDLVAENQYVLLVVEKTEGDRVISTETIEYIDQSAVEAGKVTFDFIPKEVNNCEVLLGGAFSDGQSPKLLGTIRGGGPTTVTGKLTLQGRSNHSGATVTLTKGQTVKKATTAADGSYTFNNVTIDSYTLKATMPGYLSYTKNALDLSLEMGENAVQLLGGDIDGNGQVVISDLQAVLNRYTLAPTSNEDINADGQVNITDLSILLANYTKSDTIE